MTKNFYITTTLPYVNADPHIGFALEIVQADVLARLHRQLGEEVIFNTGTDEHGQKIFEAAKNAGQEVQEYVDHYAQSFEKLKSSLNLSYDNFIRTTDAHHIAAAQEMWRRCEKAGDIYKKEYEGLYCVGCERFLSEKDIEGGVCVIHQKAPVTLKEENYFFRFSNYQEKLSDYLSHAGVIVPEWRREEALAFVRGGLEDFSISREKSRLSWGVPVPGDDTQVMYVWFDALTNYISTLGWPRHVEAGEGGPDDFKKFWENGFTLQMAGKDQVRFQSLMWQAMLMSANVKNTDQVFYHGFINSAGQKMSKSLGNVVNPFSIIEEYGTDALRYFLLREISSYEDGDFTHERFRDSYNANLANGLGNLVSRVMKMSEQYLEGERPSVERGSTEASRPNVEIQNALEKFQFDRAMDVIWGRVQELDRKIQETEPFKLIKTDEAKAKEILRELVTGIYEIGNWLAPFLPATSETILAAIRSNKKPENLFSRR